MSGKSPKEFFTEEEQKKIIAAIEVAEGGTAGEIAVRIERRCDGDPIEHSRRLLHSLGLTRTGSRTGVLIYMSIEDRKVAIFGDEGIHAKIGNDGWTQICNWMIERFREGNFREGLCEAIAEVGRLLHQHFPVGEVNPDELPNKPTFGE